MNIADFLDPEKMAAIDNKIDSSLATRIARSEAKSVLHRRSQDIEENLRALNNSGHAIVAEDFSDSPHI